MLRKFTKGISKYGVAIAVFFLLTVFFSLFFLHKHDSLNFGFGEQVRIGQRIVQQKQVVNSNHFSYADSDRNGVNNQWGGNVVFYYVHKLYGLNGLTVLALLLNLLSFFLILKLTIHQNNYWLILFLCLLVLPLLVFNTTPSPEMFSLLFFTISTFIVFSCVKDKSKRKRRYLWFLPILQLVWVNFDGLFFIGIFLQFLLLIHLIINKGAKREILTFSFIFVLSLAACCANPYGLSGVLFSLKTLTGTIPHHTNVSFPFLYARLSSSLYLFYFELVFFFSIILLYFWIKNVKLVKQNFLIIALFVSAFLLVFWRINMAMFFGYVFIIMATIIAEQFNFKAVKRTSIVSIILLLVSVLSFNVYFYSPYRAYSPGTGIEKNLSGVADYFIKSKLQGPIFNTPEMGAYLIYYLYPEQQVFADNNAYTNGFMESVVSPALKNQKRWLDLDNKYNFNVVCLNYGNELKEFTNNLLMDSRWFLAYHDNYCVLFLKRNRNNDPLMRNELLSKKSFEEMMDRFSKNEFQLLQWNYSKMD